MFVYFFVILLLFGANYIDPFGKNVVLKRWVFFLVAFIFCCGYMTGSDWISYELDYYNLDGFKSIEIGFYILQKLMLFLHVDFWIFSILTKVIILYIVSKIFRRLAYNAYYIAMVLFVIIEGLTILVDFPMRNSIAMAIGLYALRYYEEKSILKYLVISLFAISMHTSALILIPLYFTRLDRIKTKWVVAFFIVFNVALTVVDNSVLSNYFVLLNDSSLQYYYDHYLSDSNVTFGNGISLSYVLHILFFLLAVVKRHIIEALPMGKTLFMCCVIFPLLYRLGQVIPIFGRFEYYVCVFYFAGVASALRYIKWYRVLVPILFVYLSLFTYRTITANYKFVPHTNYFFEFYKKLPYHYRDNYNYKNSPYHK